MKKLITLLVAASVLCSASFAKNFLTSRFFVIKVGADVGVSNNLFAANDVLVKDLVIDLHKIADDCPEEGFNIRADAIPSLEVGLHILNFDLNLSSSVEVYEKLSVGQGLFNFLGYGNKVNEEQEFSFSNSLDIFAVLNLDAGFSVGKFKVVVSPALFTPLVSMNNSGGKITMVNTSDGVFTVDMDVNMSVYTQFNLSTVTGKVSIDPEEVMSSLFNGCGFDIGGAVAIPLSSSFSIDVVGRIPVIPGKIVSKSVITGGSTYTVALQNFGESESVSKDTEVQTTTASYSVNRPLTLGAYADKNLLAGLFNIRAGGGFGISHPFMDGADWYPEYYVGLTNNFLDLIKVKASTEYTKQVFRHELGAMLNIRFIQIDLGASLQSSTFSKSFEFAGLGAYAYVTVGF